MPSDDMNSRNAVEATGPCNGNETGVQKPNMHGLCYCPSSLYVGYSCGLDGRDFDFNCYGTATDKNAYLDAGSNSGKSSLTDANGTCRLYCLCSQFKCCVPSLGMVLEDGIITTNPAINVTNGATRSTTDKPHFDESTVASSKDTQIR